MPHEWLLPPLTSRPIRLRNKITPKSTPILKRLLLLLSSHFQCLFLLPRNLGELAVRPDEVPTRVEDGEDEQRHHHGETVQGVDVFFVKGDWVLGPEATGELDDAEDDSDLVVDILLDTSTARNLVDSP